MGKVRLDQGLLAKIAAKTSKSQKYTREQISKMASRLTITSEAAQVVWAKQLGIGTSRALASLPPHVQHQVTAALPSVFGNQPQSSSARSSRKSDSATTARSSINLATEYLLSDIELKSRCKDLLKASGKFDRVFREATTVLDDRLKRLSGVTTRMNAGDLVGKVLNPDPSKAILIVSDDPLEQSGFHSICKGMILTFRNPTHHSLTDKFTCQDALKFCGFMDTVLGALGKARRSTAVP